jgi:hypothetical protein
MAEPLRNESSRRDPSPGKVAVAAPPQSTPRRNSLGRVYVGIRDSQLVISGELKERKRKGLLRRRTRRVGQFEVRVPLPEGSRPRQIQVKGE